MSTLMEKDVMIEMISSYLGEIARRQDQQDWLKIEVEELREVLGVPASYRWVHFSEMLDKSILELREKAKIAVFIERIKTSRKITHLNIKFIEDNQLNMTLEGGSTPKKSRKKAA